MTLAGQITDYYFEILPALPQEKRFHWASRLAHWTNDMRAWDIIAAERAEIVTPDFPALIATPVSPTVQAYPARRPYFTAYTPLYGLELALFRVRHLATLYGIDARSMLLRAFPQERIDALEQRLYAEPQAVRTLSTYAVNFLYLTRRYITQSDVPVDAAWFYELGAAYEATEPDQLRAYIYLYTHCIIADSNFYAELLPASSMPIYRRMLQKLEQLIDSRFTALTLDTKLEFLVCCRLAAYQTMLETRIYEECGNSLSPDGDFLVDTHNHYAAANIKKDAAASEHRNVLYIMSQSMPVFASRFQP